MINKKKVIIVGILFTIITIMLFNNFIRIYLSKAENINIRWNIKFPTEDKKMYNIYPEPSLHMDGIYYTVIKYKKESKHKIILNTLEWKKEFTQEEINKINNIIKQIKIKNEFMYKLDENCIYYSSKKGLSELFIIYSLNKRYMYIIEDMI